MVGGGFILDTSVPVYKITDIPFLPGEVFERYPQNINIAYWNFRSFLSKCGDIIEVSNFGRIKINNIIQQQKEIKYGYLFIDLLNNQPYNVYRLVAETWCPCPVEETNRHWHVHHITNNGYDNRPENLIWVNSAEHKIIDPCPAKRINELKASFYKRLDEIISLKSTSMAADLFRDIVLIGNKKDKKKIEQYLSRIPIDITDMKDILWNNIGIKV